MPKTYTNQSNAKRVIEPLFQKNRVRFRGSRMSESENLETNLLKIDLTRIEMQLDSIETNMLNDIKYFGGNISDANILTGLEDGLSYSLDGVQFYFDDEMETLNTSIDILSKMGTKLSRLFDKVHRLENG